MANSHSIQDPFRCIILKKPKLNKNMITLKNGITVNKKLYEGFTEQHNIHNFHTYIPVDTEDLNEDALFIWHDCDYNIITGSLQDFNSTQVFILDKQITDYRCVCTHLINNVKWITENSANADKIYYSVGAECIKTFYDIRVQCQKCGIRCKNFKLKICNDCQLKSKSHPVIIPTISIYDQIQQLSKKVIMDGKYGGKTIKEFVQDGNYVAYLKANSFRPDLIIQYEKMKQLIILYQEEAEELELFKVYF